MSTNTEESSVSVLVGFGKNYYHNFGPAQQSKLDHVNADADVDADVDVNVNNENESNENHSSPQRPTVSVPAYRFTVAAAIRNQTKKKKAEKEENQNQNRPHTPPWEQENDPLIDVQCTSASSYFLTKAGKIYNCGTVHGHVQPSLTHVTVHLPLKCVQLAAGRHFCLGRMEGGLAVCAWGAGHFGQLGLGIGYTDHSNGDDDNGDNRSSSPPSFVNRPTVVEALLPHVVGASISSVSAGHWHSMALTKEGNVYAWGCNRNAQCGKKPSSKDAPTICRPQRVFFDTNANAQTQTTSSSGPSSKKFKIKKIAAGRSHSVALDEQGHCYTWGANHYGQCGILTRRRLGGVSSPKHVDALAKVRIVDISAGDMHTLALTGGGRVFGWGAGFEGQLGTGFIYQMNPKPKLVNDLDFVAIEAGLEWKSMQREKSAQQVFGASSRSLQLDNTPRITSVTAKGNSSFAVSSTGHVYAWGCNDVGHLGLPKPEGAALLYSDPGQQQQVGTCATKTSSIQRQFHTYSFDSSHNVALPQRLDSLKHLHIKSVGASSTFMWCLGTKRKDTKGPVGRTLYEVQELKRKKNPRATQQQEKSIRSIVEEGKFGRNVPIVSSSSPGESDLNSNLKGGLGHKQEQQQQTTTSSSEIDSNRSHAAVAVTGWARSGRNPAPTLRTREAGQTKTADTQHDSSIFVKTPTNSFCTEQEVPTAEVADIQLSSSSTLSEKKKRLFSPKKIVKAFVRRASGSMGGSSRGDRTSASIPTVDSNTGTGSQKSSPKYK